jgi:hypothetical protein
VRSATRCGTPGPPPRHPARPASLAYREVMTDRDEFGYPLTDVTKERFHRPVELPASATDQDRRRHAGAYYLYQTQFRDAYMAKVRARSRRQD